LAAIGKVSNFVQRYSDWKEKAFLDKATMLYIKCAESSMDEVTVAVQDCIS